MIVQFSLSTFLLKIKDCLGIIIIILGSFRRCTSRPSPTTLIFQQGKNRGINSSICESSPQYTRVMTPSDNLDLLTIDPINTVGNAAVCLHIEYVPTPESNRVVRRISKRTMGHQSASLSALTLYSLLDVDLASRCLTLRLGSQVLQQSVPAG